MELVNINAIKKHLGVFVSIYLYEFKKIEEAGGNLHNVLDDGNVDDSNILWCKEKCESENDTFGIFICDLLLSISERKRWNMYLKNWKIDSELDGKYDIMN